MKEISIHENNIYINIEVQDDGDVRLYNFSSLPFDKLKEEQKKWFRCVELQVTGENQNTHHGHKLTGTCPGSRLKYIEHKEYRNKYGKKFELVMTDNGLDVQVNYQFYDDVPIVKAWTEVTNNSDKNKGLEYVSSFALTGISKNGQLDWDKKSEVYIPHNTWKGEMNWKKHSVSEMGLSKIDEFSLKRISINNTGTMSTSEYLPMGCYKNTETGEMLFWQIENNGSWHWEISDISNHLYLQLSGPNETENKWWKNLEPKETFVSVPVAIGAISGDFQDAMQAMTVYRRRIIRKFVDNIKLPVIFNDYMNCLMGNPTTEKLLPLIDAAAEVGCEYFCIDAGWYSDGEWWDGVGEWYPSTKRFPNKIEEPIEYIKSKGMIPGLWLEIESMGMNCKMAKEVPDEWFFMRHGKRVIDNSRLHLDFRNPDVIKHVDSVINRLLKEYEIGYIKMDYNVDYGCGTEVNSNSFGDGLLVHNRAYLKWIDSVYERYPNLVIENCGSGGCRMDYAMLSRHSIQSASDNEDYRKNAFISASAPTAVLPEQCAIWSYPLREGSDEEVAFNMVNAMLMRIHQSGHMAEISKTRKEIVKEGIDYYKTFRELIPKSLPIWPLGLPSYFDSWITAGLEVENKIFLAVWRLENENDNCLVPIHKLNGKNIDVKLGFPREAKCDFKWEKDSGVLIIEMPKNSARILEITIN